MKSSNSLVTLIFLVLLFSSNSLSQIPVWEKISDPPPGSNQFKIETGNDDGNNIQFLLETSGLGLFRSNDNGTTWENIGLQGVGITAIVDRSNAGEYIVSASNGVHKTTDGGTTWQHYTAGIEGLFITDIIPFGSSTTNSLVVGTVGNGVFISNDGGETWQQMGTGLENKTVTSLKFIIYTAEDDGLYATTQEDGVWVLDPLAGTWTPINDGNPNLVGTTAIAGDSQGNLILASSPNILSSPNMPVSWQFETSFDFVNTIISIGDGEFVASSLGDGVIEGSPGGPWESISSGLLEINGYIDVVSLAMDYLGFLWAAVIPFEPGGTPGIYRTVNPITDVEDNSIVTPEDYKLEQNYPNPFNPSTSIQYQVSSISQVSLKVYDVLGNNVATLVNESKPAGSYEVEFDAKGLSSGIYFYKIQAGSFVETKKMILMR